MVSIYSDTCEKHPPPPRSFNGGRRGQMNSIARSDLRAIRVKHDITVYLSTIVHWSKLNGCMRHWNRMHMLLWSQARHVFDKAKVTSAWLPPRHRSITTPLLPWKLRSYCSRLMYTAIYTQSTALDRMLVSNSFESIGKVFQVNQVGISSLERCAIRLNWMTMGQTSSNRPTFRQA